MKGLLSLLALASLVACKQTASRTQETAPPITTPTIGAVAAPTTTIDIPKAKKLLTQPTTAILDVRTPVEYMTGHLPQARNLNVNADDFTKQLTQLDTSKTYVLYCHSGKRSGKALTIMQQHGFHHLVNGGGYTDLKE